MIFKILGGAGVAVVAMGCSRAPEASPRPETALALPAVRASCPSQQDSDYYFPSGTFGTSHESADDLITTWYSSQLRAMREPSLSCGAGSDSYRFTWLRTFDHPVAVRVVSDLATGKHTLTAIELDGAGGYAPGAEKRKHTKVLTSAEWAKLANSLEGEDFWALPSQEESFGLDGSEWILESRTGDKYHLVARWSPEDGPIRRLGLMFISLSGWEFHEVY